MIAERNDEKRYIDIWLKRDEPTPDLTEYRRCFPDYTITVWHSGHRDLGELTAQLLHANC